MGMPVGEILAAETPAKVDFASMYNDTKEHCVDV